MICNKSLTFKVAGNILWQTALKNVGFNVLKWSLLMAAIHSCLVALASFIVL